MKKVYLNVESEKYKNCMGAYIAEDGGPCDIVWVGKNFVPSVMTCGENVRQNLCIL